MQKELEKEIISYWDQRSEGYSEVNQNELGGLQKERWMAEIGRHLREYADKTGRGDTLADRNRIRILDIGTGPGFFAILLAEQGYDVTAVDFTPSMLEEARKNAGKLADRISFRQMDAQNILFDDDSFDIIVSRNVTWILQNPEAAYESWHRVLKPGGMMLNFDANWYRFLVDDALKEKHDETRKNVESMDVHDFEADKGVDTDWMESIARKVPMTRTDRPAWDEETLTRIGFERIICDRDAHERVLSEDEKINYASTPVFLIRAEKEA
ncbi:MAG: class I SAM-dependent methyltransferase [Lachnospiraceae bacterium]